MNEIVSGNGKHMNGRQDFSIAVKFFAHFFSWIFHPLFIPLYIAIFLLYIHPYAFIATDDRIKLFKLLSIFVNMVFIPAFSLFILWRLKFIQSLYLRTQKERIIPYALVMIFYFWAWYVSHSQVENPEIFTTFLLGSFITVIVAWLANIYFKISMHALAMGGLVVLILYTTFSGEGSSGQYASVGLLVAGTVCTSRMIVSNHTPFDIYSGFFIGVFCQLLAIWL